MGHGALGWGSIARLGLVQAALGAVVVMTTSTLNRVMVVELALPALVPGILVALHYLAQLSRPRMGHGSDEGGRRTPWIVGGMGVLSVGGALAALATVWMAHDRTSGLALAVVAYLLIGLGVSASGTSLLVLLAKRVAPERRAGAATVVWLMMIVGFAVTAGVTGRLLDPYSPERLLTITAAVAALAWLVSVVAIWGVEGDGHGPALEAPASRQEFREALRAVWADPAARRFAVFVFLSMLAYSAQDLILEPFAGAVMGYSPGQSTSLSGLQHGGVLVGMLLATLAGRRWRGMSFGGLQVWTVGGCVLSALAMVGLAASAVVGPAWPFRATVFGLGMANGAFSIAAIASMMQLATAGPARREGVRMGLWGAAQGVAFGLGGLIGTGACDLARWLFASPNVAYASVFGFEALMFLLAARIAWGRAPAAVAATTSASSTLAPHRMKGA
jgi:MFS transporter, BCD family, chlorophyll transporter